MREISFVKRIKFNFNGSVTKKALVIGDADNDQNNELVCANLQGNLAVFKDSNPDSYAEASELGMVTACVIGDVINAGKNYVATINMEGWLYILDVPSVICLTTSPENAANSNIKRPLKLSAVYEQRMPANCKELLIADLDGDGQNEVIVGLTDRVLRAYKWIKIGSSRGKFVGLYKWEFADQIGAVSLNPSTRHENCQDIIVAQPGGTYAKLECFNKKPTITVSSNSTSSTSGSTNESLLQQSSLLSNNDDNSSRNQTECTPTPQASLLSTTATTTTTISNSADVNVNSSTNDGGDNVRTEYISKLTPEYHQLALAQMRNHHISTEVLGGIRDGKNSDSYSLIVIATLDGTLMLVNKDEILWSLQVDHQLFALAVLETQESRSQSQPNLSQSESTCTIVPNLENLDISKQSSGSNGSGGEDNEAIQKSTSVTTDSKIDLPIDVTIRSPLAKNKKIDKSQYFVVCAWNGKTYIIDEERNYLRFKFDEAVSAFTAGNYYFDGKEHASLVYATFNNQIVLYYDVIIDHIRPMYLLNEVINNPDNVDLLKKLEFLAKRLGLGSSQAMTGNDEQRGSNEETDLMVPADQAAVEGSPVPSSDRAIRIHELLQDILYNVTDEELDGLSDNNNPSP